MRERGRAGGGMSEELVPTLSTSVLQALPQPVIVVDQRRFVVFVNYAAEAFFGGSLSVLSRQRLDDLVAFGSPIVSLIETVIERRAPMTEYRVRVGSSRFGDERIVDVFATPLNEVDNQVALLFQERTMADKIDRQLVSRGAARSVTGLASMLAHEIKNPLSGIRGAAQLLEQSVTSEEQPLARLIREETDRIVDLIDRVEVFGDDRPMEREPINIHVVLDRVKLLAKSGVARGINFSEEYDPSLPPVYGNRDQLVQVFLNLVKNAAEALQNTSKPEIKLSTAFRPGIRISVQGVSQRISLPLEILVEDNGPGIAADLLPILFDPFVTTKANGSGLGLALVAKIIGDHGGVVDSDSRPGRTKFRVLLPVASGAYVQEAEEAMIT
jgi:two-component system nitrogen regulation sensor histidine kinase GlnL